MTDKSSTVESMLRILKEEFNITNEAELDTAIKTLSVIDISLFCADFLDKRRSYK